jgi:ABC-2 type transport system ATP-binding protein
MSVLQAENLCKSYNGTPALDALTLSVGRGEVLCLLGANGAGKTTTINLFLGFTAPTAGRALVGGHDVAQRALEARRLVAYIPEQVMLYGALTGVENLEYFASLAGRRGLGRADLRRLLIETGLPPEATDRRVSEYSKGMRQKVGIAIAVAKEAKALLLDEPTSGLDPQAANEFTALLRRLSAQGVAVLMATHDIFRAKEAGTRVGIMKHGRLVAELATGEIGHVGLEQLYLQHMHD